MRVWETACKTVGMGVVAVIPAVDCPDFQAGLCFRDPVSKQIEVTEDI